MDKLSEILACALGPALYRINRSGTVNVSISCLSSEDVPDRFSLVFVDCNVRFVFIILVS